MTTKVRPGRDPESEACSFLDKYPNIVEIDAILIDVNGVGRGKRLRRHELIALFRDGRYVPMSSLGLMITGEDVDGNGLVWETGDCDKHCKPVPNSLGCVPLEQGERGFLLLTMFHEDGSAVEADARQRLSWQIERAKRLGYHPIGAFELEFFLIEPVQSPGQLPVPAKGIKSGRSAHVSNTLSVDDLDDMSPFFAKAYQAAESFGIQLETLISEFAPGQFELTIRHQDLLRAADELILVKRILKICARHFGFEACFMAKPFATQAGSGMHLHVSLNDDEGNNLFADQKNGALSKLMLQAIAGVKTTVPDTMVLLAPNLNSWRRFAPQSYAPTQLTWGRNNRTVAIRVPAGKGSSRHFEHRIAGVDANPYLVATATLAGALKGIENELDPGDEIIGNGYLGKSTAREQIPAGWQAAISLFEGSEFAMETLGPVLHKVVLASQKMEFARACAHVSDYEYFTYQLAL